MCEIAVMAAYWLCKDFSHGYCLITLI